MADGLVGTRPDCFLPVTEAEPLLLDRDELRWMRSLAIAGAPGRADLLSERRA